MTPVRWDPFRELEEMNERLNRAFGGLGRPGAARASEAGREALTVPDWAPVVDITETDEEYLIKAEIPEVKREDVKVSVENGVLTMQGERKQEKEEKGKKFHRVERYYGSFLRTFTVPDNNIFQYFGMDVPGGTTSPSVADGYYVMLTPLPPGPHTIYGRGVIEDIFFAEVTYHLTVGR